MGQLRMPDLTNLHAVDFGTGDALCICGPNGRVSKRALRLPRGALDKTPREEFIDILIALLRVGDVVVESPTVGSSGAEVGDVISVLKDSTHALFVVPARAVKNYRLDYKLPSPKYSGGDVGQSHAEDAEIIYAIVADTPVRARLWKESAHYNRKYKTVRPMDKRGYKDEEAARLMRNLPPFSSLPPYLQSSPVGLNGNYCRSIAVPFAQAMEEPYLVEGGEVGARGRFHKIIGNYDHGYPSHYRRMSISWMHKVATKMAQVRYITDVPRSVRKAALRETTKQIRHLFHVCRAWMLRGEVPPLPPKASPPAVRRIKGT